VTLTIEQPREWRWDVKSEGDLVGMVIGNYHIGFLAIDHEGIVIGNYWSLTRALLAISRDAEIRTLEAIWSLS